MGTVNLTLKNVPEAIAKVLKREARYQGRSLNSELNRILADAAEAARRRARWRAERADLEAFVASLPPMPSSVPLIRAERNRH